MRLELTAKEVVDRRRAYQQKWKKNNPWMVSYDKARDRCNPKNPYGKRGIKLLMTAEDFKFLWFRDKAYLMKKPSINREYSDIGYEKWNCRFMEIKDNMHRSKKFLNPMNEKKYKEYRTKFTKKGWLKRKGLVEK